MRIHLYRLDQPSIGSTRPPARSRIGTTVGPTVVTVTGDLDLPEVPSFLATLNRAVSGAERTVVVDLARLDFISISGVQALADTQDRANCRGVAMLLVHDGPVLGRALEVTGMADHFHSFPSVGAAVDARRAELAAHAGLDQVQVKSQPA